MKILKERSEAGWIVAVIDGRYVEAKVYDTPSCFGVNDGRVSKLFIGKTNKRDPKRNYFDQMDYAYDRGEDFNELPEGVLDSIVNQLEEYVVDSISDR